MPEAKSRPGPASNNGVTMAASYGSQPMGVGYGSQPMSGGYGSMGSGYGSQQGFAFKKRFQRVDWKKIAAVDVDAISRNLDFYALQDNILNVTFCNIEAEIDPRMVEPNMIKLFRLAQLTIEYLLHSQDYLSNMVEVLETKLKQSLSEQEENKKSESHFKDQLSEVKKESHKRKKLLLAQQQILQAGTNAYNKCQYCSKAFMNVSFLQSHIQRRHAEAHSMNSVTPKPLAPVETVPKEPAAPIIVQSQPSDADVEARREFERQLQEIKERLVMTESQLTEERNARNSLIEKDKRKEQHREKKEKDELIKWKEEQQELQKKQMSNFQDMLLRELNELNDKYQTSQNMLEAVTRKQAQQSNLGAMQDELETQQQLLERQREEASMLNEQLRKQMDEKLQEELQKQEKKWSKAVKNQRPTASTSAPKQEEPVQETRVMELSADSDADDDEESIPTEGAQEEEEEEEIIPTPKAHQPQVEISAPVTGAGAMYDDSEDDDTRDITEPGHDGKDPDTEPSRTEHDDDRDLSTEFDGTSTFTTTRGTMSMGQFAAGTLSMTEPPSERLLLEMRKNPNILKILKKELLGILEQELIKRGIPENAIGLTDAVYNSKLQLLKNERQHLAKKYRNIYDIRQQYLNTVEQQARDILKSRAEHVIDKKAGVAGPSRPASSPASRQTPSAPKTSDSQGSATKQARAYAPVPAPRSTSPPQMAVGGTGHPQGPAHTSMATTAGSSTWDEDSHGNYEDDLRQYNTNQGNYFDDEDDDDDDDVSSEDDDDDDDEEDYTDGAKPNNAPPTYPGKQQQKPVKNTRFADDQDEESDSNWDELSDMDTLEPTLPGKQREKFGSTPPRGQKVAELSRSIELQMSGRGKKPVGGVSMIQTSGSNKQTAPAKPKQDRSAANDFDDDDESFPSVSSVSPEEDRVTVGRGAARHATRNSMGGDTEYSTNTYGTSVWGSSKGGVSAPNNPHNTSAKTFADSDVWDSDVLTDE